MKQTGLYETDVLIIGCGIAGGTAALQLADAGIAVTIVTMAQAPHESNTFYAQGGIIYRGTQDSARQLVNEVFRAGAEQGNLASIDILARQGPELVEKILLERVNVAFDRDQDQQLSLVREGGHSQPRIIHAADTTGRAISTALLQVLKAHPNVTFLTGHTAVDLIVDPKAGRPGSCAGAYLLDRDQAQIVPYKARQTILATGGLGQLFSRTTNPAGARGDGVAMAHRVGARVADMEYVQFHPTTFYHPQSFSFLISEAVRGAGARLVDAQGIPFMAKYEPAWQDLAPRDVVARSVYQEMTTRQVSNVYLDLASYIPKQTILQHFPAIYQYCLQYGVDLTRDLVPVVPAAHYACGGVETDHWGRTGLAHLYAVGEVAHTGVHGANRLASTSLLEGLVWGYRAARHIQYQLSQRPTLLINHQNSVIADRYNEVRPVFAERPWIDHQLNRIKQLMWAHVGLIRTTTGLRYAARELRGHKAEIETIYQQHFPDHELVGLRNMAQTALLVTTAALKNKQSLGCHYRLVENQPRRMPYQPVAIS